MAIARRVGVGFAVALVAVALSGCSRGPDQAKLRSDLEGQLDRSFEEGLFRIESFHRMGSSPGGPDDAEAVLVYYDALLRLERSYSLTGWKGLNLGTLAFVLGATENGIDGFKPRGNDKGDVLRIHGRLPYRRDEAGWVRVERTVPPKPVDRRSELRGSGPDAQLAGVRDLIARSPDVERRSRDGVIVNELRRAVSRIDLGVAPLEGSLTFGAGPPGGTYHAFGKALAAHASRNGMPLFSYPSNGSVENGARIQNRTLDFGLIQSDVADRLYEGWARERIFPHRELRSVASLWPEAMHVVTLDSTGIETVDDLRGRRVAIGQLGSGTRANAIAIGIEAGLGAAEVPDIRELALAEAIEELEAGRVDALFVTEAIPSALLQALASRRSDVRFVSLEPDLVTRLSREDFAYYPLTIDPKTYPGQQDPIRTIGLACALMTHSGVDDASVEQLLALMVDGVDELSRRYFRAGFVAPETMRLGMAVPLHPAAERFYDQRAAAAEESEAEAKPGPEDPAAASAEAEGGMASGEPADDSAGEDAPAAP